MIVHNKQVADDQLWCSLIEIHKVYDSQIV